MVGVDVAAVLAYSTLRDVISNSRNRGVVSVGSIYRYLREEPFLRRTLASTPNYQPRYRLQVGEQALEECMSEETLAGIALFHASLGLTATELHLCHPDGELQLKVEELLLDPTVGETTVDFAMGELSLDSTIRETTSTSKATYPLRAYCATVAASSSETRNITFESADFVTGVRTAACWLRLDLSQTLTNIRSSLTQEVVQVVG